MITTRPARLALAADGDTLVGSDERTVSVWSVENGAVLQSFAGHTTQVLAVAVHGADAIASKSSSKPVRFSVHGSLQTLPEGSRVDQGVERRPDWDSASDPRLAADGPGPTWPTKSKTRTTKNLSKQF